MGRRYSHLQYDSLDSWVGAILTYSMLVTCPLFLVGYPTVPLKRCNSKQGWYLRHGSITVQSVFTASNKGSPLFMQVYAMHL